MRHVELVIDGQAVYDGYLRTDMAHNTASMLMSLSTGDTINFREQHYIVAKKHVLWRTDESWDVIVDARRRVG